MLGTITAHINIEKLNEIGKKMLNTKLECHLARPHTLPYEVSTFIYIYIDIFFFFERKFQSIISVPNDNSLSSD